MNPDRWEQISRIFQAALARGAQERVPFLEEACAGDDALRRAVESLLRYQDNADRVLNEPAAAVAGSALGDTSRHALPGGHFGAYTIVSQLGAGGMGLVYRARDP